MNSHKNARLTFEGRKLLIECIALLGLKTAAHEAGIRMRTARKWQKGFQAYGLRGLMNRSSRPIKTRSTIDAVLLLRIELLRRNRMSMRRIAATVVRRFACFSRVLARMG